MTTMKEGETMPAAAERTEQIVSRAGTGLGRLAGQTVLRFQQATQALREKQHDNAEQESAPSVPESDSTTQDIQAHHPATERAEKLVDQFGQRVGHWAAVGNQQAKRTLARLREDTEDILVEAQGLRGTWERKRGPR